MNKFYLSKILLKNYRQFENEEFLLNKQMNVFIGKNSSGKTTILEAVNVLLGAHLASFKKYVPNKFIYNLSKSDIRLKEQVRIPTDKILQYPCKISCIMQWNSSKIKYSRIIEKENTRTKFDGNNSMQAEVTKWEKGIEMADNTDNNIILPLVLYLSSVRLLNKKKIITSSTVPTRPEAYQRCLHYEHGIDLCFEYIRLLCSIAVEENDGISYPVYKVLTDAVSYGLKEKIRMIFSFKHKDLVLKKEDGRDLLFNSLSDNYKNIIKIILDIAVRMCILNPQLKENVLKETSGIVIIDDLELNLDSYWQKNIVRILKNLFPKVQFFCSTNSSYVIDSLEDDEKFVL